MIVDTRAQLAALATAYLKHAYGGSAAPAVTDAWATQFADGPHAAEASRLALWLHHNGCAAAVLYMQRLAAVAGTLRARPQPGQLGSVATALALYLRVILDQAMGGTQVI